MFTSLFVVLLGQASAAEPCGDWGCAESHATAHDAVEALGGPEEPGRSLTVSVSPLRLTENMMELTGELRAGQRRSIAVVGARGAGRQSDRWELGGQLREYVIGNFSNGILLGGQAKVSHEGKRGGRNTSMGPFIGVKTTLALFSIEADAGADLSWSLDRVNLQPKFEMKTGFSF